MRILTCLSLTLACLVATANEGTLKLQPIPGATFSFGGVVGERIEKNVENWLIPAPVANPGMIQMFHMRDRLPAPQLVPWAGEFVGKYLLSAIPALRMTDNEELLATVTKVVKDLIASQADDGYLGPFPKDQRLLANWDLWGHYHAILALLMWHEERGDKAALDCAKRAADLVCNTYLNTTRRPIDAGSDEMNLAIIHGLGKLYRVTKEQRYLDMMRVVEEDWQKAGDYFREGLKDTPFYLTPRPRWESLHDLQGLVELYRITGNEDYRTAFLNLWKSIRDYDVHNTGGFSTGESAIGNPHTNGAIETCCTIAWHAITLDALMLTGEAEKADQLELSFYNAILGAQHPSGRWWTYNTPMDGKREASAHTIVFQSRAGTPELNCCSVNGPRGLSMLTDWAVMQGVGEDGVPLLVVNYLGSMEATLPWPAGEETELVVDSGVRIGGSPRINIKSSKSMTRRLLVRLPSWSRLDRAVNGFDGEEPVSNNGYLGFELDLPHESVAIDFQLPQRIVVGAGDASGKMSIYLGPILMAFDTGSNEFDVAQLTAADYAQPNLGYTKLSGYHDFELRRLMLSDGRSVHLQDFASAGAHGTEYISWIPATNLPPRAFNILHPLDNATIPVGKNVFRWEDAGGPDIQYTFQILDGNAKEIFSTRVEGKTELKIAEPMEPGVYMLQVSAERAGKLSGLGPASKFTVDPTLPNDYELHPARHEFREDGVIVEAALDGTGDPAYGSLESVTNATPTTDRHGNPNGAVSFNGKGMLRYHTPPLPTDQYTVMLWFRVDEQRPHIAQVFSAWAKGGDDPLRLVLVDGKLHARIEGFGGANSKGAPVETGKWYHAAAVKDANRLRFYLNGEVIDDTSAPHPLRTTATAFALGGNPYHTGDEHFVGAVDDLLFIAKSLTPEEIAAHRNR